MNDETEVQTRHKRTLEKIREKEEVYDSRRDGSSAEGSSRTVKNIDGTATSAFRSGETSSRSGESQGDTAQREDAHTRARTQGMAGREGTARGHDQGVRPSNPTGINSVESHDRANQSDGATKLTVELSEEEKAEKERERNRQKQQRFRDRQKEAEASSVDIGYGYSGNVERVTSHNQSVTDGPKFALKNPLKFSGGKPTEPVKLLTKTEADDAREALIDLFCKGTSILDDILEIIVRDHEPVTIWEMDTDEATLFVDAHLKRAQKEQDAARTARILLRIYDKFFTVQYLWSRSKRTFDHVKEHRGLSFR